MNLKCWQPSFVLVLMVELWLLDCWLLAPCRRQTPLLLLGKFKVVLVAGGGAKWATCAAATLAKSAD